MTLSPPNPAFDRVMGRVLSNQISDTFSGSYQAKRTTYAGIVMSKQVVLAGGQYYPLVGVSTAEPGTWIAVQNVSRRASAIMSVGGVGIVEGMGGGSPFVPAAMQPHDIVGAYHTVAGRQGLFVGTIQTNRLGLMDPEDWVKLWIGRKEGPREGLWKIPLDDGTIELVLQATDTGNDPFFSVTESNYETNTARLEFGYHDAPHIYLEEPTAAIGDPEQHRRIVVPLETFERLISHEFIDLTDLAEYLAVPIYAEANLPDAQLFPAGRLVFVISPGDSSLLALGWRDNLDNWQGWWGAGYAMPHTHTSPETGGVISAAPGATRWEPLTNGDPDNPALVFDGAGDVIMCEVIL